MILAAKTFAPALTLDFAGGRYVAGDRAYASPAAIGEVEIAGPGGVALAPDGTLHLSPAGQPRIAAGVGMLIEPAAENLLTMRNADPIDTAGWTLLNSRPPGATIARINDLAALEAAGVFGELLAAGRMNGWVIRCTNPVGSGADFAVPLVAVPPGARYAMSAYVRCLSGEGYLTVTAGGGSTPAFSNTGWQRVGRVHTPTTTGGQGRFVVRPGGDVLVILAQAEVDRITSPIIIAGYPVKRAADRLTLRGRHLFARPHTIVIEAHADWGQNTGRRLLTIGGRGEYIVERAADNSVAATRVGSWRRPRVPRVMGAGRLRVAHRIASEGHSVAAGGVAGHAPFEVPPALDHAIIGATATGGDPINGWVRSIEIVDEVDDAALEALAVAPAGSVAYPDARRYVSPTGDDAADGATPATAWRTLAQANAVGLWTGTHLHIARGGTWPEMLRAQHYVTYRPYGAGAPPRIGIGAVNAVDSAQASDWRLLGLDLTGSTSRGVNGFGASGVMIDECEVHHLGSTSDPNAGGIMMRAATRQAQAVIASATGSATLTTIRPTEAALTGGFTITCTVAGSGGAARWQLRRPDGSVVGTFAGGASYTGAGVTFTVSGVGAVGDRIVLRTLPFAEIAYPTTGVAEQFRARLTRVHDIVGSPVGAGDDLYLEGIGGTSIVEGCELLAPSGRDADALQMGRNNDLYHAAPGRAIVRHNAMVAGSTGGKGAVVILTQTADVVGNHVRGHNFGIGIQVATGGRVRWNAVDHSRLNDYSWAIGCGGDQDCANLEVRDNVMTDCNRGVAMSGTGNTTLTLAGRVARLQARTNITVTDNVIRDVGTGLYIDRPTTGRMQLNSLGAATPIDRRVVSPTGKLLLTLNRVGDL